MLAFKPLNLANSRTVIAPTLSYTTNEAGNESVSQAFMEGRRKRGLITVDLSEPAVERIMTSAGARYAPFSLEIGRDLDGKPLFSSSAIGR